MLKTADFLIEKFGLEYKKGRPMIALISRLVDQKGLDLIRAAENELQKMDAGSSQRDIFCPLQPFGNHSNRGRYTTRTRLNRLFMAI